MNLETNHIRTSLLAILIWRVGAIMGANGDQWNDYDQSHLLEGIDNSQEVQEALLKIHFAAMAESRSQSDGRSSDRNITMDMSKADFENIVVKINSEVALLRSQALILSRAYKELMAKHRKTLRELNSKKVSELHTDNNRYLSYESQKPSIPCPNQPISPPPVCNCNCSPSYSETVMGNKYYYYTVVPSHEPEEHLQPPWKPPAHKNPTPPNYHQPSPSSSYRPTRFDPDDPDPVHRLGYWSIKDTPSKPAKVPPSPSPTTSPFDSKYADLQSIVHRLDHRTDKWKQPVVFDPWQSEEW